MPARPKEYRLVTWDFLPQKLIFLSALVAAATAAAAGNPTFSYDRSLPFSLRVLNHYQTGRAIVEEVSFAVDRSTRVNAYLVQPENGRKQAEIVFSPGRSQTRDYFLSEAIDNASRGVTSISLNDERGGYPSFTPSDPARLTFRVVVLRRAIDLLHAQPRLGTARVAYVGLSDGAELGGMIAGVERRVSCYVLMSGGGVWDRSRDPSYNRAIAPYDADNYISRARPASLFFQSGLEDSIIPRGDLLHFQRLGSQPKFTRWYRAGHLLDPLARIDRERWLAECLRP
jgi:dienelactone hydrolase